MQLIMITDEHGTYTLDEDKSAEFLFAMSRGIQNSPRLNKIAASCCGHNENAFNNVSGSEALFMWIESGNYTSNYSELNH